MKGSFLQKLTRRFFSADLNQHRNVIKLHEFYPNISPDCHISPHAAVIGDVEIGSLSTVWGNSVVRGDLNSIMIGCETFIHENCSLSAMQSILHSGEIATLKIGDYVTVMPGCTLVSCSIEDECIIGANSVICEGVRIEKGAVIGPNSVVPPNRVIPAGEVWVGNPVRFDKAVTRPERIGDLRNTTKQKEERLAYQGEELAHNDAYLEVEKCSGK